MAAARQLRTGHDLLLVCRDPIWFRAVRDAAGATGRVVAACDARDAIARLAGTRASYSHLLLEDGCADGLLDALTELTSRAAGSQTEMLMLGGASPQGDAGVIHSATSRSVQDALQPRRLLASSQLPAGGASLDLAELRAALNGALISARYQPIVRLHDREPIALEVLARLDHPQYGTILPDRFVPQIENAGLAAQLTELVAARAFADLAGPQLRSHQLALTINLPLDVVLCSNCIDRLDAERRTAGLPAERVIVELTERTPVVDFGALCDRLDHLRALGYCVAIDDMSPELPGLDTLLGLPFTSLKLDKSVVSQAGLDARNDAFISTIIGRAHATGKTVVAEGVETVDCWRRMRDLGTDAAQGYLIARPLPLAAVPVWLEDWRTTPTFG